MTERAAELGRSRLGLRVKRSNAGMIIVVILLSVYLPIFSIMSQIKG